MSDPAVIGISVLLQGGAIVLAMFMVRYTKASPGWIALVALLSLQLLRSVVDLFAVAGIGPAWIRGAESAWLSVPLSAVVAVAMAFMLLDLRRRAKVSEHLKEAQGRYGELFERNQAPMLLMDPDGAHIRDVNDAAVRFYGYSRNQMRGMHMSKLCPIPLTEVMEQVDRVGRGLDDRYHFPHVLASGEVRDLEIFSGAITVAGEQLVYQIVVDVTERNVAQRELADQNRALEVAVGERTAALSKTVADLEHALTAREQFLAGVSHELRTPLNSIIGYSGVMLGGMAGTVTDEQRKQLEMVSRSARHLLTLINDVLDVAQLDAGNVPMQCHEFNANTMVDEVVGMMAPIVREKGLTLQSRPADPDVPMCTDITKVEQILLNLIGNAVKFTPAGSVSVSVDPGNDGKVSFIVADTGVGIPGNALPRVTEAFVQLPARDGMKPSGVGLGLSISKRLAAALGGELVVSSVHGQGSAVALTIPCDLPPLR